MFNSRPISYFCNIWHCYRLVRRPNLSHFLNYYNFLISFNDRLNVILYITFEKIIHKKNSKKLQKIIYNSDSHPVKLLYIILFYLQIIQGVKQDYETRSPHVCATHNLSNGITFCSLHRWTSLYQGSWCD